MNYSAKNLSIKFHRGKLLLIRFKLFCLDIIFTIILLVLQIIFFNFFCRFLQFINVPPKMTFWGKLFLIFIIKLQVPNLNVEKTKIQTKKEWVNVKYLIISLPFKSFVCLLLQKCFLCLHSNVNLVDNEMLMFMLIRFSV